MKPILAIDLDGALMYSRPFDKAHEKWFELMSDLLDNSSYKNFAFEKEWFLKVDKLMDEYLGDVNAETKIKFARELYAMATIAEVKKEDLVEEFAGYLRNIRDKYSLALITTAPEPAVEPILQKVGCKDLFDIIKKSPVGKKPSKKELLEEFVKEHGKPKFYIGNGDNDIKNCRELGIPTISVSWVNRGEFMGDYNIDSVKELDNIL